jgi:hypothetical protein
MRLDLMPNDLAGKVRELGHYDFESAEAQRASSRCSTGSASS